MALALAYNGQAPLHGVRDPHTMGLLAMLAILADIAPLALGIAWNPFAITAVLLLLAKGQRRAAMMFLLGWLAGLIVLAALASYYSQRPPLSVREATLLTPRVEIGVGLLLIGIALVNWLRGRAQPPLAPEAPRDPPRLMAAVSGLTPARSFGVATLLAGVNPKNLLLLLSFTLVLIAQTLPWVWSVASVVFFIVLSSVTVAVPVIYALARGADAEKTLRAWQAWLAKNQSRIVLVLLALIGLVLVARGWARLL